MSIVGTYFVAHAEEGFTIKFNADSTCEYMSSHCEGATTLRGTYTFDSPNVTIHWTRRIEENDEEGTTDQAVDINTNATATVSGGAVTRVSYDGADMRRRG